MIIWGDMLMDKSDKEQKEKLIKEILSLLLYASVSQLNYIKIFIKYYL